MNQKQQPHDLRTFLYRMEIRPGMYLLSDDWITALAHIIMGWKAALLCRGEFDIFEMHFFDNFSNYVHHEFNDTSTRGWFTLIKEKSMSNEESVKLFFEIFRRFEADSEQING